jgi:rubrerythrin
MSLRPSAFFPAFQTLLTAAGVSAVPACALQPTGTDCGGPYTQTSTEELEYTTLESALEDSISTAECASLCQPSFTFDENDTCSLSYDEDEYDEIQAEWAGLGSGGAGGANAVGGAGGAGGLPNATLSIECEMTHQYICEGRRHATWGRREQIGGDNPVGHWLARAAANEAGSVQSFRCLALELGRAGRGEIWARRLRQAARDEIRHARSLERLAGLQGSARPKQEFRATEARSLLELALENAREGCVGETWAGLLALHQAHTAEDPGVRAAFQSIARDEAMHADLAWDLHEWLLTELPSVEREQLAHALDVKIAQLASGGWALASAELSERALRALGLPGPAVEEQLRRRLGHQLQSRRIAA